LTLIVVQDRSPLFATALSAVLTAESPVVEVRHVLTDVELIDVMGAETPDIVVLEVTSLPWDLERLLERIYVMSPLARLVGVVRRGSDRTPEIFEGPVVARDAPAETFVWAVLGPEGAGTGALPIPQTIGGPGSRLISERELQTLGLLAAGCTTREVAERLGQSPRSVRATRERLFQRLNVQSRAQAVAEGIRLGLIGPR
jgi:DNA-binding NarL/FixJ family response regulator